MNHAEKALYLFHNGYNCAQSVFAAFSGSMQLDEKTALRLASSFGGGIGRMREVCGAVSGALMVLGCLKGYDSVEDRKAINQHYANVQHFASVFRSHHGTILCRELLGLQPGELTAPQPTLRSESFYQQRPCDQCISDAVCLLEEMLSDA